MRGTSAGDQQVVEGVVVGAQLGQAGRGRWGKGVFGHDGRRVAYSHSCVDDGLAAREAGRQLMPPGDGGLALEPAEEDAAALAIGQPVDEAAVRDP